MIEQHVSALLNVKSSVKALSMLILSPDQPVELLLPGHTHCPCSVEGAGVLLRAKSATKRSTKESTLLSELAKIQLIIK